jgi:hypothetical protein
MAPLPLRTELCTQGNLHGMIFFRYVLYLYPKSINLQPFFCLRGQEQKSDDNNRDGARIVGNNSPDSEHRLSKSLRPPNYEERNSTRDRCVFCTLCCSCFCPCSSPCILEYIFRCREVSYSIWQFLQELRQTYT